MSTPGTPSSQLRQQGFVSLIAVLALILVVAAILKQSVQISGTHALAGLQQNDSVAALAQAQSGSEIAIQKLSAVFNTSPDLNTACDPNNLRLDTENNNLNGNSGPASFSLVGAVVSVNGYCKIRVKGSMRAASRTIETWVQLNVTYGTVGFGTNPSLTLTNLTGVPALALFDTGWGVKSSDGQTTQGNSDCTDCQNTNMLWYAAYTGLSKDIGGAGNYSANLAAGSSAPYQHTLSRSRNYAMVGEVLGGSASQAPQMLGSLNASNMNNDQGTTTSASANARTDWCSSDAAANAMVIGVSAKGPGMTAGGQPDLSGKYDYARFSYNSDATGPGIQVFSTTTPNKTYVHYPDANANAGLSTPIAWGDVFVEMYYAYQAPLTLSITAGGSGSTTVTVNQTYATNSLTNRYLQPSSGKIANATYITGNTDKTVTLNQNPLGNLNGSNICTGMCGFFPTSNNTSMTLTFGKASGTVGRAWVGGIVCLKGVDDNKVQLVTTPSGITVLEWHEVLSTEWPFLP